jgi:[ribosomal protein S18]-alanine N-acetyltransferase
MAAVAVRPMRRRDLRRVLDIEERAYPRPWSASLFADELARSDTRRYLVALAPDARRRRPLVVGYAGLLLQDVGDALREAHVTTVAVDPAHHRRKIATHLMLALMRAARETGAGSATLEVRAANRGAQRLYSAFGFAPVGVRPRYYAETGEDAVIMWVHELQSDAIAQRLRVQEERLGAPGGSSGAPDDPVPWVRSRTGLEGQDA